MTNKVNVFIILFLITLYILCAGRLEGFTDPAPQAPPNIPQTPQNKDLQPPRVQGCVSDSDCNTVFSAGSPKNVCTIKGECMCFSGSGIHCQLGPNNYKNPSVMTAAERETFMKEYRPDFTLHDYTNWLLLFNDQRNKLPILHLRNLQRLSRGEPVILPNPVVSPADLGVTGLRNTGKPYIFASANDYFVSGYANDSTQYTRLQGGVLPQEQALLDSMQKTQLKRPRVSPLTNVMPSEFIPVNYNNYPEYAPEQVTLDSGKSASDFVNNKIDAHELNYYIRPQVYPGDIEIEAGRQYIRDLEEKVLRKTESPESYHLRTDNYSKPAVF